MIIISRGERKRPMAEYVPDVEVFLETSDGCIIRDARYHYWVVRECPNCSSTVQHYAGLIA